MNAQEGNQPTKPWLPNLERQLSTPSLTTGNHLNTEIPLGLLDIPSRQAQEPSLYDVVHASHTAIFSSPGYGKSTTLQTIVMNLARQNTPEQVQFYLLDFGTNGLLPLKDLPHVADITCLDEDEKLEKVLVIIKETLENRKHEFQRANVTDYHQYESKENVVIPIVINVLDGYDALSDDKRKDKIDVLITQILREGAALGVYLLITANRAGAINNRMSTNIQTNIVLNLIDEMEVRAILGEKGIKSSSIAGRGQLIVNDAITAIQIYLAVQSKNDNSYIENLINESKLMNEQWTGRRPLKVPILPNPLTYKEVEIETKEAALILGYSQETTLPYLWEMDKLPLLLVSLDTEEQGYTFLEFMLRQFKLKNKKTVLIDGTGDYVAYENQFDSYLSENDVYEVRSLLLGGSSGSMSQTEKVTVQPFVAAFDFMADFAEDLDETVSADRQEKAEESIEETTVPVAIEGKLDENTVGEAEEVIYYIPDLESVFPSLDFTVEDVKALMKQHKKNIIFVAFNTYIAPSFTEEIKYLRSKNKIGMFGVTRGEQKQVAITGYLGNEDYLDSNEFYVYQGRKYEKIRLPMEEDN